MTPREKAILKARAVQFARATEQPTNEAIVELVEFSVERERYAVETREVREVWPLGTVTPIPGGAPILSGVANVHGEVIGVVDLRKLFEKTRVAEWNPSKVVIVHAEGVEFGLGADFIGGLRELPQSSMQRPGGTIPEGKDIYARYLTLDGTIVLDISSIISALSEGE